MEINDGYYPNTGNNCFFVSLANLLVELEDYDTAEKVMSRYQDHLRTTSSGGLLLDSATILVNDLTDSKYVGTLKIAKWEKGFDEAAKFDMDPNHDPTLIERMNEELKIELNEGRIIPLKRSWIPFRKTKEQYPYMVLLESNIGKSTARHAVVALDNNKSIDNGYVRDYRTPFGYDVLAVLDVAAA